MFGVINKLTATTGSRDEVVEILAGATGGMPGCRAYIIAKDTECPDAIWVTEFWDDKDSHAASLELDQVKQAMKRAMPMIADVQSLARTEPETTAGAAPILGMPDDAGRI